MRYIIFTPQNEDELDNVVKSLNNIAPELDETVNILLWTDVDGIYIKARSSYSDELEGAIYNEFLTVSGDKVSSIKEVLTAPKGSVILVHPNHILGYGSISALYFADRIYKYGLIGAQLHDGCIDCPDVYDETTAVKNSLEGHEKIGDEMYMVDNVYDATIMVKLQTFKDDWYDDGNLGIYLRRMGYCNFVDKGINIKRGK